jgi:hypothetical protein
MMEYETSDIKFKHPFSAVVAGPSSSGKTVFVRRLLQHHLILTTINSTPLRVIWAYGVWQDFYNDKIPGVDISYMRGLPSEDEMKTAKPDVIVIDDLMSDLSGDKRLSNLFTRGSHHWGVSVIYIMQNLFHQSKEMRDVHTSTNYLVLFKSPRDSSQVEHLARQVYPRNKKFFQEAFEHATNTPYSYLIVDLKQTTPEKLRLRTRILPEESIKGVSSPACYIPLRS